MTADKKMKRGNRDPLAIRPSRRKRKPKQLKVTDNLFSKNFKSYDEWRLPGWNERLATEFTPDRLGIVGFHILNELRLQQVRRKAREGRKIRVAFYLDCVAIFKTRSLYAALRDSDLFEPFIALYSSSEKAIGSESVWQSYLSDCEKLDAEGYEVRRGYDRNRNYIDIGEFDPDIVIINSLYHDRIGLFTAQTGLNLNYLTCVFNYGFNCLVGTNYDYYYNNLGVNTAWVYFIETRIDFGEIRRYSRHFGSNTVFLGMPMLDEYAQDWKDSTLPEKARTGRRIVVIAPHWSIKQKNIGLDRGTFHLYSQVFLDLMDENPDITFVFKPHPKLGYELGQSFPGFDYPAYLSAIDSRPNACVYTGGDYIALFKRASLLITDSGSFLVEWLPSGAPCEYLVNPFRDRERYYDFFSRLIRKIVESYYPCFSANDIRTYFDRIIREGWDPNKEERAMLADSLLENIGCAGKKIAAWLKKKICGA